MPRSSWIATAELAKRDLSMPASSGSNFIVSAFYLLYEKECKVASCTESVEKNVVISR